MKNRLEAVVQFTAARPMGTESNGRIIRITEPVRLAMQDHALRARPAECCGLLSGRGTVITNLHALRNEAATPLTRYFASPEDLFSAMRRIREAGEWLMGIYHSHPRAPAYPSASDVGMAFYPEAVYFIISLEPQIDLRAFRIAGNNIEEVNVVSCA
jgi:proteasome lid subunit RPN8/RPN11